MNESLLTAMETYGLVGADGDGSEADINTDIQEMLKVFSIDRVVSIVSCMISAIWSRPGIKLFQFWFPYLKWY